MPGGLSAPGSESTALCTSSPTIIFSESPSYDRRRRARSAPRTRSWTRSAPSTVCRELLPDSSFRPRRRPTSVLSDSDDTMISMTEEAAGVRPDSLEVTREMPWGDKMAGESDYIDAV